MRSHLATIAITSLAACQANANVGGAPSPEYIAASGASALLPFSPVVRVGNMLYLAGQMGIDPATGTFAPGGIQAETRQAMENIKAIVLANGSSMDRVVKCTVMLADMNEWSAMNAVYVTYFPNHKPARSAFGTSGLARGGRAEIECMALVS